LDPERARLEELALSGVRVFGPTRRDSARLFAECKIWIAAHVRVDHRGIARKRRGDPEFLLAPINVRNRLTRLRSD
jgi:hypothetical protein